MHDAKAQSQPSTRWDLFKVRAIEKDSDVRWAYELWQVKVTLKKKAWRGSIPGLNLRVRRKEVPNTPHTGAGASERRFNYARVAKASLWQASVNVSGWGTHERRKASCRMSPCGVRVSGKKNRNGNSSTHSKAREGFPVRIGALTDRAVGTHRHSATTREGEKLRRLQMSQTAKSRQEGKL